MNQGPKVLLGVLALGGIVALVVASEKKASAATPPILPPLDPTNPGNLPLPPNGGGIVVVPPVPAVPVPPGQTEPVPSAPAPVVIPVPPAGGIQIPGVVVPPSGTTVTIPGIGTFNPATGAVFGPDGVIVGTFNPATGVFTPGTTNANGGTTPAGPPVQALPPLPPIPVTLPGGITVTPGTAPTPTEPPASPAEGSSTVSRDTLDLLSQLLSQEHSAHWRLSPDATVKAWQAARGLVADGQYGPATALKLAASTGMIPIVRGWPKGSQKSKALPAFQAALRSLAATAAEPRRSQLLAAAVREQGQGYGTPETPIATLITLQDG